MSSEQILAELLLEAEMERDKLAQETDVGKKIDLLIQRVDKLESALMAKGATVKIGKRMINITVTKRDDSERISGAEISVG